MSGSDSPKWTRGSRGFQDVFSWARRPSISEIDAAGAGHARKMSCHIRSNMTQLPQKFTFGMLFVTPDAISLQRYTKRKDIRKIPVLNRISDVRTVSHFSEWNTKRGLFKIVVASGPGGVVEMAVPNGDVPLLRSWIEGSVERA
jgi:hypothetical protein